MSNSALQNSGLTCIVKVWAQKECQTLDLPGVSNSGLTWSVKFWNDPDPPESGFLYHLGYVFMCVHMCSSIVCSLHRQRKIKQANCIGLSSNVHVKSATMLSALQRLIQNNLECYTRPYIYSRTTVWDASAGDQEPLTFSVSSGNTLL